MTPPRKVLADVVNRAAGFLDMEGDEACAQDLRAAIDTALEDAEQKINEQAQLAARRLEAIRDIAHTQNRDPAAGVDKAKVAYAQEALAGLAQVVAGAVLPFLDQAYNDPANDDADRRQIKALHRQVLRVLAPIQIVPPG